MATSTQSLAEKYKNILSKSRTAYNPGSAPTASDISAQQNLMKAQTAEETAQSEQLKEELYGAPGANESVTSQPSYLRNVLHTLGAPMYGIVGGVEALLGRGTKKGLANIPENIKEEGTWGDLIRSYGVSNLVAAPLGFALDVASDPFNWVLAGTGALIPRIGVGALKGGLEGASAGLKSGALMKAEKLGKIVPGLTKKAFSTTPELAGGKMATAYRNLSRSAVESREVYEGITDTGLIKALEESVTKVRPLDRLSSYLEKTPTGRATKTAFAYDTEASHAQIKAQDIANRASLDLVGKKPGSVESLLGKDMQDVPDWMKNPSKMLSKNSLEQGKQLVNEAKIAALQKDILQTEIKNVERILTGDKKALGKLGNLSEEAKADFIASLSAYRSDLDKWDKRVAKALLLPYGKKILDTYAKFIGLFKTAKIGGGILSAGTNASVGNPFMALMRGVEITDPEYFKSVWDGLKVVSGKDFSPLLKSQKLMAYMNEYPLAWTRFSGVFPGQVVNGRIFDKNLMSEAFTAAKKAGIAVSPKDVKNIEDLTSDVLDILAKQSAKGAKAVTSTTANLLDRGIETSMISTEVLRGPMGQMVKKIKKSADEGSAFAKFLHWYLTVPMETYSGIDQAYKVGNVLKFVEKGISYDELIKLAKTTAISPNNVAQVAGRNLFKLDAETAVKIANDIYMDYMAMPGFVKIMRNLPILGSPFMCRSEDTEILTNHGWKKYYDILPGDLAMSYHLSGKFLEWQPIIDVHIYNIKDEDLYHIKSRSLDIIASPDHDMVVAYKKNIEKGKVDGKRKREHGEFIAKKIKMKKLAETTVPSIVVGAENGLKVNNLKIISNEVVELIGWFVTEGFFRYKRNDGGYGSFCIVQAKPEGVKKIKDLVERLDTHCNIQVRKKKIGTMMNYDSYTFCFSADLKRSIIDVFVPDKQLTISFLNLLTKEQLLLLYNTMIMADGTIGSGGEERFCQKFNETSESFQVLILMIGRSCTDYGGEKRNGNKIISANKGLYRQVKRNMPKLIKYTGKIWCPQVSGNGTWVARRNGRIDITGNSFAYGMSAKVVKTAIENPVIFNKVNFAIKEVTGERSPLEKEALSQPYYEWYNRPGMLKLPFFEENPVYLNMENMIPYYTMNVFQPAERDYKSKFGSAVASIIDKSPFIKSPEGQVIFDYIIQPLILQGEQPKGMFNQPLWLESDTVARRVGRAAQSLTESVMPTMAGYTGLVAPWGETGQKIAPYLPSYRWRQLAFAKRGKSSWGIQTKEPALEKTARVMAAMAGWPTYQVKLTNIKSK